MELYFVLISIIALTQAQEVTFSQFKDGDIVSVNEDESIGFVIMVLELNSTNNVSYNIKLFNSGGGPFQLSQDQRELILSGPLDYESQTTSYIITLVINTKQQPNVPQFVANLNVTVKDVNEAIKPVIAVQSGDVSLNEENTIGAVAPFNYTVSNLNNRTATYIIKSQSSPPIFNINPQTGEITLNTIIDADRPSAVLRYTVELLVNTSDAASASTTLTLHILDINDNTPQCIETIHYSQVTENETAPVLVYGLNCSDKDYSPSNRNLSYSIVQGNTSLFSVNNSGAITTIDVIDYDVVQVQTLVIRVQDNGPDGGHSASVTIIVSVVAINDNKPQFSQWVPAIPVNQTYTLAENSSIGTTLFTVRATDKDVGEGSSIVYSINVNNGSSSISNVLTVDTLTGAITLIGHIDADEGTTLYTITVTANDSLYYDTITVYVQVTDVNDNVPKFVGLPQNITLWEQNCTANLIIANITAFDADVTKRSLTIVVKEVVFGNISDWQIISTSQTTGELALKRTLDLDTGDSNVYLLKITVRDGDSPELTATATVILYILPDNQYPPEIISTSNYSILENATVGTALGPLVTRDNDTGPEGRVVYSISDGNVGSVFGIDLDGNLKTIGYLDKETVGLYNLTIQVKDTGVDPKTATVNVFVTVTDVNEHMPECPSLLVFVNLTENATIATSVFTFNCTDKDGDHLTYFVDPPENETFNISGSNDLKLIQLVNYDSPVQHYLLKVGVSDGTFRTTVNLRINLMPVNEDQPKFSPANVSKDIAESGRPVNPILTFKANDTDYSPDNIVSYSLKSDLNSSSLFTIDHITGEISLLQELDYESLPDGHKFYILEVVAEDGGGLKGTGTVTVNVLNINDNPPRCSHEIYTVSINETQGGTGPFNLIQSLDCIDVEDGVNLNFTLTQTPGSHFGLKNQTVQLLNDTLDYETATSHQLTIVVSDNGSPALNTSVYVYVKVVNMNDGPPAFATLTPVTVPENTSIGSVIAVVNATDPDGKDPIFGDPQYSIISGDTNNHFSIGIVSGEITLKKTLDFETETSYNLFILTKERAGQLSSSTNLTINVADVNDEVPVCYPNFISRVVSENEAANHLIAKANCTDQDAGTNLTYMIADANNTLFQMKGNSLTLLASLDFETKIYHEFLINVTDGVHVVQIDTAISVGSVNEFPPIFEKDIYVVNISEAANISTLVTTVHANDKDSHFDDNGIVKYLLSSSNSDFLIDLNTGAILVADYLDRETTPNYTLQVTASDANFSNTSVLQIIVTDTNDNSPNFTSSSYIGLLSESSPTGTSILKVTATDKDDPLTDGNGIVTYSIVNTTSYFKINESTGEIQNSRELGTDQTGVTLFTLVVLAQDKFGQAGSLSSTALVNIIVTTVNQNPPVFSNSSYFISIRENQFSFGDVILTVSARDNDTGIDGQFTYSFLNPQTKFSLTQNGSEGEIRLKASLDFDKGDQIFVFIVIVTDKGEPAKSGTATVTIRVDDVNDNPPVCTRVIYMAKVENSNNTDVANLHCSDADISNNLTYSVSSVSPNRTSVKISSSGIVSLSAPLDYEASDFYEIIIVVYDDREPVHNTTVTINLQVLDINDNDPSFIGPFAFSVNESDSVTNLALYRANTTGNDGPTDVVTYSLIDRTFFDVSPTTGEISLRTNAPDYEKYGDHYNLTVCATDTPNPVSRKVCQLITVTIIDINDNVPVFSPSIYSASVREDELTGKVIGIVTAKDADISLAYNQVHYEIVNGNADGKFSIDANGSVTINATLDYETTTGYNLVIQASDTVNTANVSFNIMVLPVNEFTPEFTPSSFTLTVPENTQFDSNYTLNISATDKDKGLDGIIYYSIDAGPFNINPNTGVIKVIDNIDREKQQSYVLNVRATDKGTPAKTGTLTLTMEVGDVNDNAPTCTSNVYTAYIKEGTRSQSELVTKLMCQDDDKDPNNLNNKITYSIVSGETTKFEIDQSGNIQVKANVALDYEADHSFELSVQVSDNGPSVKLNSYITVVVMVTDMNDNTPVFTSLQNTTISEDSAVGQKLLTVHASDEDSGDNGLVMYSITKGNDKPHFRIDPVKGDIYLISHLDFETQTIFELEITAKDQGTPSLSTVGTLTISVKDINDNPPVCIAVVVMSKIPENSKNVDLAYLNCTDADTVGTLSYSIKPGTNSSFFSVNQTGIVKVTTAEIDYEAIQQIPLQFEITDGVHTIISYVEITVEDVNEFDPKFSPLGPYSVSVPEDTRLNTLLIRVNATDGDIFDTNRVFSIVSGDEDRNFIIDPITGSIRLFTSLDYERKKSYLLTLQVQDSGFRNSTAILNVAVVDVNDNIPFCNDTLFVIEVYENALNLTLFTPDCQDLDSNLDLSSRYTLVAGNLSSLSFNRTTGAVKLISPLDYENMTSHTVVIKAFDNGPPDVGVNVTLTIVIRPVNEYTPAFVPSSLYTNISVSENAPIGLSVTSVSAIDQDKGGLQGSVRYYIIGGDPDQYFEIEERSGQIKTARPLDRETVASYNLTVEAVDDFPGSNASKSANATVLISVADVNDNTPVFSASLYTAHLSETNSSHVLVTVTATDKDDPLTSSYGYVTYKIVKGASDFSINPVTGDINNSHVLDADLTHKTFYTLTVAAIDSGGSSGALSSLTLVTVIVSTVNEFTPEFSSPSYDITINETQYHFGDKLLGFFVRDNDTGTDGEFNLEFNMPQIKFSLVQDGNNGTIILNDNLDFELNDTIFHFQILAKDKGVTSLTGTADITIRVTDANDNLPMCVSVINADVTENNTFITNFTCRDQDVLTVFHYTIASITPANINATVSSDGVVTVSPALDYEKSPDYQIQIHVSDGTISSSDHTSLVTINVRVRDLNDNYPTFTGPFNFTIREDEPITNKALYKVNASSNDGPSDFLTYSLSSSYFAIAPLSGEISLKSQAPDYETIRSLLELTVCVKDTPNPLPFTVCQNISVTIIDVNDNSPVFSPSIYSISVPESVKVDTVLSVAVTTSDKDTSPQFHTLTYSIIDGNMAGKFRINSTSGAVSIAQLLDYENTTNYVLTIQATDSTYTANASCFIQVLPVNEYSPVFSPAVINDNITENTLTNFTLNLNFNVKDQDSGLDGQFLFSIDSGPFSIDPSSGLLSVVDNIDREKNQDYVLLIRAIDKGVPALTGTLTLSVYVLDVNDNSPDCGRTFFTALIAENFVTSNTLLAALVCHDADNDPLKRNNAITYNITSNPSNWFEVTATGVVKVKDNMKFDRETQDLYTVIVKVSDLAEMNRLTTTVTVEVYITDINDNYPYFTAMLPISVPENASIGLLVTQIMARDNDTGVNAELVYSIAGGNQDSKFRIDSVTGNLFLENSLDYEKKNSYLLNIIATDKGSPPLTSTTSLTVSVSDVNDEPPTCPKYFYSVTVSENSQNVSLVSINCNDNDIEGSLSYTISKGNVNNSFEVDVTGNVLVTMNATLNYEGTQSYLLEVQVSDRAHSISVFIKVSLADINEFRPSFTSPKPYNISVKENTTVGSQLLSLNATDDDIYDTVKIFSFLDSTAKFILDSNLVKVFSPLDYEQDKSYTLRLMVQDSTALNDTTTLTIMVQDVNDNSPVCSNKSTIVNIDENVNGTLYIPSCTDADKVASPVLSYSVISGSHLSINNTTGVLSVVSGFDYETNTSLNVVLQISDNGSPALSTSINIRININPVNEFPPVFVSSFALHGPYSLSENASLGTLVTQVMATDEDKGQMQGTVRYEIVAGDDQQYFYIDESSGDLKVIKSLDRETRDTYNLTIKASDDQPGSANQRTATAMVSILVTDINDNIPVLLRPLYILNVTETAIPGPTAQLLALTVQDSDIGVNSQTTIAITAGNDEKKFSIQGNSLILMQILDYDITNHYNLVLTVTDKGSPALSSSGLVVINVLPSNNSSPLMNVSSLEKSIPEDTPVGTLVFDANASDLDKGLQGMITYTIVSGVTADEFVINSVSGQMYVGSALDFDAGPKNYSIIIRATDGNPKSATASLSITLTDVNDNAPVFNPPNYSFNVNENAAAGISVGQLTVTDADSGINGQISVNLTGGTGLPYFTINSNMQLITSAKLIDYEISQVLYLIVSATDGGSPTHTSNCLVKIDVNNMNDNFPTVTPSNLTVHILESAAVGAYVQSYVATDVDTGSVSYQLTTSSSFFDINSTTGVLTVKAMLDREKVSRYTLQVLAMDKSTPVDPTVHTSTATLTVMVDDVNDNAPVINNTYFRSIPETVALNELVFTISATDADNGVNHELVYAITAGNIKNAFAIDIIGNVLVASALDPDVINTYTLTITVSDKGTPSLSASTMASIFIQSVNDPPVFQLSSFIFSVDENSPVGKLVGVVTAVDKNQRLGEHLTYSFVSFSLGSFAHFIINSTTGEISVASANIDRETTSQYKGIIQVTDGGIPALTATADILITINDLDDNGPVFNPSSYSKTIKENQVLGSSLIQLTTTDADTPANSGVVYSINTNLLNGNIADSLFQVSAAGLLTVKAVLDYETYKNISFVVQASKPNLQLAVTASILIVLSDENDNSPVFKAQFINSEIDYTKLCGVIVTQATATDADSGDNGRITYSLETNTYGSLFSVDAITGDIKMTTTAEQNKKYTVIVRANDAGVPQLSSTATVRIDTFDPANVVLSFLLSISKSDFVAQQSTFLTNLQAQLKLKYPKAVLKLWCIIERDGIAVAPGSTSGRRRRQTTSKPVTVSVYGLQDETTNSASNLGQDKQYLGQSDLNTAFADVLNGNGGSQFNYYGIQSTKVYATPTENSTDWWHTVYGPIITALLILLGLILIAIIIFCCCRHYRKKKRSDQSLPSEEPEIPPEDYSYRHFKGYQGLEFYPVYPRSYPVRLANGDSEQFSNPYFSNKRFTHL